MAKKITESEIDKCVHDLIAAMVILEVCDISDMDKYAIDLTSKFAKYCNSVMIFKKQKEEIS